MSNGGGVCEQRHRVEIGNVERQRVGEAALGPDRRRRLADLTRRPRRERHMRPRLCERGGGGQPNPPPRARDERAAAVEAEGRRAGEYHSVGSATRASATPA